MGYIQEIEKDLKERLVDLEEERQREVIKYVKEKILESYRNGIKAPRIVRQDREVKR